MGLELQADVSLSGFQEGDEVEIEYKKEGGEYRIVKIEVDDFETRLLSTEFWAGLTGNTESLGPRVCNGKTIPNMKEAHINPLHQALFRILRPLARLLLRNGIPYGKFSELVKRAYVEAALEDFPGERRKPTDSGAAVMTGLTRKAG